MSAPASAPDLAAKVAELTAQIDLVRQLCDAYKDQPPPIFRGPGLSEFGQGHNQGTRDIARAVLSYLDSTEGGAS